MNIVEIFLNALQNKINVLDNQISEFENKKNQVIELKNFLYAHEILDNQINVNELINFSNDEIKNVLSIIDEERSEILYKTYAVYKPLVEMHDKIKAKYSGDFEAPQYLEASKWLEDMCDKINSYLQNNTELNEEYINDVKNEYNFYNEFYKYFNGNELVRPIGEFDEFNTLLDKLNFNNEEKYQIKKFIGIGNIKLLDKGFDNTTNNEFDKYKVILKNKKKKYSKLYESLKDREITIENVDVKGLCIELNEKEYDVRQALLIVFIESIFDKVRNGVLKINEAVLLLEDALDFSRKVEFSDLNIVKEEKEALEEIVTDENTSVIQEANDIIANEKELINSINEAEFSKYLAQSINDDSEESIKYQIVSILLALLSEVEKYNNVKDLETPANMVINNIKEYIEAYKNLKNKLESK